MALLKKNRISKPTSSSSTPISRLPSISNPPSSTTPTPALSQLSRPPIPDPNSNVHPTLTPSLLQTAIASLSPALELLERFHHRNKNQHRLSKWWAQADMLRRHVRKMLGELEEGVEVAERAERARARGSKKGSKGKGDGSGKGERGGKGKGEVEGNVAVSRRAEYLRWKLGPGAFLAFTQLAADRQFAHLGLMLLGVLAQVDRALTPFASSPSPNDSTESTETEGQAFPPDSTQQQARSNKTSRSATPGEEFTQPDHGIDMGEAVSREDMDKIHTSIETEEPQAQEPTTSPSQSTERPSSHSRTPAREREREKTRKRKSPSTEALTSKPGEGEESRKKPEKARDAKSTEKKPRKAKKAVGGGDEFDDIFGSLDNKSTKPKKKKKAKKGDEFDDIFGELL